MSGNNFLTKHVLRRRVSEHRPYGKDSRKDDSSSSSSSSSSDEDEGSKRGSKGSKDKKDKGKGKDKDKPEWVQARDPYGRLCWQSRKTGQVTYGNSITTPQHGYNPNLAQQGFSEAPMPPIYGGHAAPAPAASAMPVGPPGYMVPPGPYITSPVPGGYGHSPVAMYSAAPWSTGAAAPLPMAVQVPDYVKKQMHKEKKRKQEEERKKLEKTGTWQRHYSSDGSKFWQNTASGRKSPHDPYK